MTEPIEAPVRRGLADQLVEQLLAAVLDGHYPPGSMLPPELEIARMAGVSRLTVREAVKALKAKGVFRVEQGRGTFVNLPEEWSPLDSTLLAARANQEGTRDFLSSVLEARRLVELGTAELAAQRRTDEDLAAIGSALESMHEAQRSSDVKAFVDADIRFHRAVMDAAGNPLISALFEPIQHLVYGARFETSSIEEGRAHALDHHARILTAIQARRSKAARSAMDEHLTQTEKDSTRLATRNTHNRV